MNLVAKEYVAAQDPNDPGVLILSRFAGAAVGGKRALLVNPYDAESVAGAIAQALSMSVDERRERHAALLHDILENDVKKWQKDFLDALRGEDRTAEEIQAAVQRSEGVRRGARQSGVLPDAAPQIVPGMPNVGSTAAGSQHEDVVFLIGADPKITSGISKSRPKVRRAGFGFIQR
jgi:hypothetical protein